MKWIITTITLITILLPNTSLGQHFRAGLTGGFVGSDVAGAHTRGNKNQFNKLGFTIGGLVNFTISEKNTFQLEINYIQKGSLQRPDSANLGYFKYTFNYIEVPFIFRRRLHFTLFKKPSSRFDLGGGISIGRLLFSQFIGDNNYIQSFDTNEFNKTDVSILVGIDYNLTSNLDFCFRYSNSIIPVTKKNTSPGPTLVYLPVTINQGNNMVFQFCIKYVFGKSEGSIPNAE